MKLQWIRFKNWELFCGWPHITSTTRTTTTAGSLCILHFMNRTVFYFIFYHILYYILHLVLGVYIYICIYKYIYIHICSISKSICKICFFAAHAQCLYLSFPTKCSAPRQCAPRASAATAALQQFLRGVFFSAEGLMTHDGRFPGN